MSHSLSISSFSSPAVLRGSADDLSEKESLVALFQKAILAPLQSHERELLQRTTSAAPSRSKKTPFTCSAASIQKSVQDVFSPLEAILRKGPINQKDLVQKASLLIHSSEIGDDPAMRAALSNVILAINKLHGSFLHTIQQYIQLFKRLPFKEDLQKIVDLHNKYGLLRPELAGKTFTQINELRVYYSQDGSLALGTYMDQIFRTRRITPEPPILDNATVAKISQIYANLSKNCPFSNATPFLELMRFYRECKEKNPTLTLAEAFESFCPDPLAFFEKYHSGNCIILSAQIQHHLHLDGIDNYQLTSQGRNKATSLPIVTADNRIGFLWKQHMKAAYDISHVETFIPFKSHDDKYGAVILHASFEDKEDTQLLRCDTSLFFEKAIETMYPNDHSIALSSFDSLLKKRAQASYKLQITETNNSKSLFGIDLLQGNIYLSSEAMKDIYDKLPLNEKGRVSIPIEGLQKNEIGSYILGGRKKELHHWIALAILIKEIEGKFNLPPDTRDNIATAVMILDEYFDTVAFKPLALFRRYNQEILQINDVYNEIYHIPQALPINPLGQEAFALCKSELKSIHRALDDNDERELISSIDTFFQKAKDFKDAAERGEYNLFATTSM